MVIQFLGVTKLPTFGFFGTLSLALAAAAGFGWAVLPFFPAAGAASPGGSLRFFDPSFFTLGFAGAAFLVALMQMP